MKKKFSIYLVITIILLGVVGFAFKPLLKNLNFGLDLQGGFEVLYKVESIDSKKVTADMTANTYKTISRRIDVLGVSEPSITVEGNDKIRVQLAGVNDPEEARDIISKVANLTFRDTADNLLMPSTVLKSGGARVSQDNYGKKAVSLAVLDKDKFYKVTKSISEMKDNRIVIWLDYDNNRDSFANEGNMCGTPNSNCLSVASVDQGFSSDVIIQGDFTDDEVTSMVELINSGSLPTKLVEISSKTVGASFGANTLDKTFLAGMVGIGLIALFMICLYRFAGFISAVSIIVYTFITILVFWLVGGVLTLPGIAALVIGIGMAIDACILNFARIKDEMYEGKSVALAHKFGNKNSFMTILDANITTLIVAIILFVLGESSIKGFATMLIISIFVTMIIMVFFNRKLLTLFINTGFFEHKPKLFIGVNHHNIPDTSKGEKRFKNDFTKLDFVKYRKLFMTISSLIIIVGAIVIATSGLKLGIDFKGGTSISLVTDKTITTENIKVDVNKLGFNLTEMTKLDDGAMIKISDTLTKNDIHKAENYFSNKYDAKTDIGVVSDVVKKELIKNAILSLIFASFGITIYMSLRFKFDYGISTIIALLHDVFIVIAIFSVLRLEISSIFIAAILSIIGYSINDKIVTFDRIRENIRKKKKITNENELTDLVNTSLRSVFTRSITTTFTTLIPVVALIFLGSREILNFNLALLFGLVIGVYSSLLIAAQIWLEIGKHNLHKNVKKKWDDDDDDEIEELKVKGVNY
ncbi:MAG: protein translocase subunit SecD [Bacilli bacterium]